MDYNAPYGSLDPDASYVDRSVANAQAGSKVPAKAVELPQREIVNVIEKAGLTPSNADTEQLWKALQVQLDGIRLQFPIFPECRNSNGTFDISTPSAGTIRVPAGIQYVMRGGTLYTTAQTNLTTLANKTYHLRWDKTNGFRLRDLADTGYNPTAAAESNAGFDTTYDDILIARVVTNGSNVAAITNLKNKAKLILQANRRDSLTEALNWVALAGSDVVLNWGRTPEIVFIGMNEFRSNQIGPNDVVTPGSAGKILNIGARLPASGATRYAVPELEVYYEDDAGNAGIGAFNFLAAAL